MPRTLAVHVGWPKTATTTVQAALGARRDDLLRRGVLYPKDGVTHGDNHVMSVRDLFAQTGKPGAAIAPYESDLGTIGLMRSDGCWDLLVASVARFDGDAIISAENLVLADAASRSALLRAFPTHDLRVVVTTRPVSAFLPSLYQQYVKAGGTREPDDFIRWTLLRLLAGDQDVAWLDVVSYAQEWEDESAAEVTWVDISRIAGGHTLATVGATLGVPTGTPLTDEHRNPGLSAAATEGIRRFGLERGPLRYPETLVLAQLSLEGNPELADSALGGRLAVSADLAAVIDAAYTCDPASQADPAVRTDARAILVDRLAGPEPLSVVLAGAHPDDIAHRARTAMTQAAERSRLSRLAYRSLARSAAGSRLYWHVRPRIQRYRRGTVQ